MKCIPFQDPSQLPDCVNVGEFSYAGPGLKFLYIVPGSKLDIGRFVCMAQDVTFLMGGEHPYDRAGLFPFFDNHVGPEWQTDSVAWSPHYKMTKGPIRVGNDVWIGYRATILSGVTIGDGAVIAAGAVVVKDVEPYSIVGGTPAKTIRRRFDDSTCDRLLRMRWWNWDDEIIKARRAELMTLPIGEFLARYG